MFICPHTSHQKSDSNFYISHYLHQKNPLVVKHVLEIRLKWRFIAGKIIDLIESNWAEGVWKPGFAEAQRNPTSVSRHIPYFNDRYVRGSTAEVNCNAGPSAEVETVVAEVARKCSQKTYVSIKAYKGIKPRFWPQLSWWILQQDTCDDTGGYLFLLLEISFLSPF
jgi:hypothetical protein